MTTDCVRERIPRYPLPDREIWHIAPTRGRSVDFCPIRCSTDEGITLPGPIERREPTCPACVGARGGQR